MQILDYKKITNQLITINSDIQINLDNKNKELNISNKTIIDLTKEIKNLKQKIITLEENLTNQIIKIEDINFKIPKIDTQYNLIPEFENNATKVEENDTDISPTIFFDEEKRVDGFHIELKQKF
ncbi:MAG: hypothetical protein U9Q20_02765 [Campylobacterota bacterium]|nr:hypothetical protein [Campylobacterota bacterium]